ncbi:MAG: UDP-2,3-diacylglucosamine diphosphatase LpxI, partial [Acidobacteria bacterium]|nr:UDP-2,3-diacylglucosamine diphosphatase LpxI [Acidobacteriota bacterium]
MAPLGLIAGNGRFPLLVLEAARSLGHAVTVVAVREETGPDLVALAASHQVPLHTVSLGQLGTCIQILQDAGCRQAVMAGQVKHAKLFANIVPDWTLLQVLLRLRAKSTDALIAAIADVLEGKGIELLDSTSFLQPLVAGDGHLAGPVPDESAQADLAFGYTMADAVAGLDIGQTLVVKDRAVVAVEAMEGTDETIRRGGRIAGPGACVIKVAKPDQDMRFDVPVVGLPTVAVLQDAGIRLLSIDAGRTLILDGAAFADAASRAGIT